jgi:16S rRNA (guanine966-N2)-methyltransferase
MSQLRIVGGQARGRVLRGSVPPGVRPTSARVREAVFDVLGHDLSGASFLDAFGGSAMMAFEAWSRGAERVVVCEQAPRTVAWIREQARALGAPLEVLPGDVLARARAGLLDRFDLVFADPPYALVPDLFVPTLADFAAQLVVEAQRGASMPERAGGLMRGRLRQYGGTVVCVYGPGECLDE